MCSSLGTLVVGTPLCDGQFLCWIVGRPAGEPVRSICCPCKVRDQIILGALHIEQEPLNALNELIALGQVPPALGHVFVVDAKSIVCGFQFRARRRSKQFKIWSLSLRSIGARVESVSAVDAERLPVATLSIHIAFALGHVDAARLGSFCFRQDELHHAVLQFGLDSRLLNRIRKLERPAVVADVVFGVDRSKPPIF